MAEGYLAKKKKKIFKDEMAPSNLLIKTDCRVWRQTERLKTTQGMATSHCHTCESVSVQQTPTRDFNMEKRKQQDTRAKVQTPNQAPTLSTLTLKCLLN